VFAAIVRGAETARGGPEFARDIPEFARGVPEFARGLGAREFIRDMPGFATGATGAPDPDPEFALGAVLVAPNSPSNKPPPFILLTVLGLNAPPFIFIEESFAIICAVPSVMLVCILVNCLFKSSTSTEPGVLNTGGEYLGEGSNVVVDDVVSSNSFKIACSDGLITALLILIT